MNRPLFIAIAIAVGVQPLIYMARNDQRMFREVWDRTPAAKRVIFPSQSEAFGWTPSEVSGLYFIPNNTKGWWQFWRPAYRPVFFTS